MRHYAVVAMLVLIGPAAWGADQPDILVADFEGDDYGDWIATGEAFGSGPARGTLPGQMPVKGFEGRGLVNSFYRGDGTTGTLTSPPLVIRRRFLNFLIGGGGHADETCVNLLCDGRVVRTATGPNTAPGGSEQLQWHTWDVGELIGKSVVVQIVDRHTGGWGHINVDQFVQSQQARAALPQDLVRSIVLERDYLHLPVANGAAKRRMQMVIDGTPVRVFDIELAPNEPDWWAYIDIRSWRGRQAVLKVNALTPGRGGLRLVDQTDEIKGAATLYDEPLRPQFHFSQKRGWNNDPNGMVYHDGEYHLFFQHNPYGVSWGNMHWGHAVSRDLVHWDELPIALYPWTQAVAHCYSGSAVVDQRNTAGFQTGDQPAIVAVFTDTGCGESLAYSNDRGRTFTYYAGNPVLKHRGRDPKVIWYEPGGHWVMAVYDEADQSRAIAFYSSSNLKDWQLQSRLEGYFECPEIFELPVDGDPTNTRWVVFAGDARYAIGRFDGRTFTPEHEGKHRVHWGAYYASQTFSGAPDGRRIGIGWGRIDMDGMAFNQMMTFPCALTLRTTDDGIRLFAAPVREIERLHRRRHALRDVQVSPDAPASIAASGRLFDIRAEFAISAAPAFGLQIGPARIGYETGKAELLGMPLAPVEGRIRMQVLVDRSSLEVCGNDGRVYLTEAFRAEEIGPIRAFSDGGTTTIHSLEVYELESSWPRPQASSGDRAAR